jgi:hypothetical protein
MSFPASASPRLPGHAPPDAAHHVALVLVAQLRGHAHVQQHHLRRQPALLQHVQPCTRAVADLQRQCRGWTEHIHLARTVTQSCSDARSCRTFNMHGRDAHASWTMIGVRCLSLEVQQPRQLIVSRSTMVEAKHRQNYLAHLDVVIDQIHPPTKLAFHLAHYLCPSRCLAVR